MAPGPSLTESSDSPFEVVITDLDVPYSRYPARPQSFLLEDDPFHRDTFIPPLFFQFPPSTSEILPVFSLDPDWGVPQNVFLLQQTSHETLIFQPQTTETPRNVVRTRIFYFVEFVVLRVSGFIAFHGFP